MKTLVIQQHPKMKNDYQVGWDFGDGHIITFGAVPKDKDLDKFISDLRKQQISIGNDDFDVIYPFPEELETTDWLYKKLEARND